MWIFSAASLCGRPVCFSLAFSIASVGALAASWSRSDVAVTDVRLTMKPCAPTWYLLSSALLPLPASRAMLSEPSVSIGSTTDDCGSISTCTIASVAISWIAKNRLHTYRSCCWLLFGE